MDRDSARKALILAAAVTGGLALLRAFGVSASLLLSALAVGLGLALVGWLGGRLLTEALEAQRRWRWRAEEGRYHAFAGARLRIEDDGRHCWVAGSDLQQVLGTRDAEDVLAARHAGQWRRGDDRRLWLRVDSVVERLATMPGRADPRSVRLRRYLEREVLYPAARRRERAR